MTTTATFGGAIVPNTGWYNAGANVTVTASANAGYSFTGFSGALSGTSNPQTLTMNSAASVAASFSSMPTITTTSPLTAGTTNVAYSQSFVATGGIAPYTWLVVGGTLPPGLTLRNGVLSGTPTTAATYSFTVQATDNASHTANRSFSLTISPAVVPLTISTNSPLPDGTVGTGYSITMTASSGNPPYSWSVASGTLPMGMNLSGTGLLSGTPTKAGNSMFTAHVADNAGHSANKLFSLSIASAPAGLTVSCAGLPNPATPGQTVTFSAFASGGAAPYTYIWSGVVSGGGQTASFQVGGAGTYTANLTVTDSQNHSGPAMCSVIVAQPTSTTPGYDCSVRFIYDNNGYIGSDGSVYFHYALYTDSAPIDGVSNINDWQNQVVGANLNTPSGTNFGPTNGPIATGSQPSEVQLPTTASTLSSLGFGEYIWGADFQNANPNCGFTHLPEELSGTIPPPMITSLSPSNGVIGTQVTGITVNGVGLSGATDVMVSQNGQPAAGIVAGIDPQDDNTVNLTVDLTDPSVKPGTYDVSLFSYGVSTNSLPFMVGDTMPTIDTVEQPTPLSAGGQGSVVITGSNFGPACLGNQACSGASLTICNGADPCSPSDVTPSITSWSDTEIMAQLNAGPNASGFYDVQITSAGATGQGFQRLPSGGPGGQSPRKPGITVSDPSGLSIRVTSGGNQLTANAPKQCAYIDPTPAMPQIVAQIVDNQTGQPVTSGTATWQLVTTVNYVTRIPVAGNIVTSPVSLNVTTPQTADQKDAGQAWTVPFSTTCGQSGQPPCFFGGNSTLKWTYTPPANNGVTQPTVSSTFNFQICGANPDLGTADSYFASIPYWFIGNLSIHETRESQFCEPGRTDGSPYCLRGRNPGKPIFGQPAGYGMMQLDPVPSVDAIWSWVNNIVGGKNLLDTFAGPPQDLNRPGDPRAYQFWFNQVRAWQIYNQGHPKALVPAPAPDMEGNNASFCTFIGNIDPNTNLTSPTSNVDNNHWFGDAILMRQYAAGYKPYYIRFGTDQNGSANWLYRKVAQTPIRDANGNVVQLQKLPVWEFCTCSSPSSCQNTSPGQ